MEYLLTLSSRIFCYEVMYYTRQKYEKMRQWKGLFDYVAAGNRRSKHIQALRKTYQSSFPLGVEV